MAKASTHQSSDFVKMLYVGASGTGKTSSLVSLLEQGYKLRVLDMDNGLDALIGHIKHQCPDKIDDLDYITLRDKIVADPIKGTKISGTPKAYVNAMKFLSKWDDDSIPSEWGNDTIFVLDTLTSLSRAAFRWAQGMNPTSKDPRQWYGAAQSTILDMLDMLTSEAFQSNVIVISHIDLVELPDGTTKGYTSSIGKALGPKIPSVFNTMIMAESTGSGENVRRTILTLPTQTVELKNPRTQVLPRKLPIATGMAEIFTALKG